MVSHSQANRASQVLRIFVAAACVLLIVFIGAAQVLHTHAATEAPNPGCSLCAVAHLSVLTAPVCAGPLALGTTLPLVPAEIAAPTPPLFSFATYVRPPPALTSRF